MDIVDFSQVKKQLVKVPKEVIKRLQRWAKYVQTIGLRETRKIPGFHDEPLKGKLAGKRSVRLGIQWRVIYTLEKDGTINIVKVEEVVPHEY